MKFYCKNCKSVFEPSLEFYSWHGKRDDGSPLYCPICQKVAVLPIPDLETSEKLEKAKKGIILTKKVFSKWIADFLCLLLYAFTFKLIFPLFMGIVAIEWPEWVVVHSGKFTSWVVVLFTVNLLISFVMPTAKVKVKLQDDDI